MKKKMLSLVLAATMLAGASMTTFAATITIQNDDLPIASEDDATVTMEATIKTATIKVTVVDNGTIMANPYGLKVATVDADGERTLEGAAITFKNESDIPIEVGLKGKVELPTYDAATARADQLTIASDAKSVESAETKQVYVQAEIIDVEGYDSATYVVDSAALYFTNKGKAVAPLVYDTKGATLDVNPVLAGKGYEGDVTDAVDEMAVVITGATSASATSQWSDDDKFTVKTIYDLKMAKTPSSFAKKA